MHALIVVAHPKPGSLSHSLAAEVGKAITEADPQATIEVADLMAERFDPIFTAADIALQRGEGPVPADVTAEHARIARADALVLVYPVYWWSMPALLKGWVDRVFTNGWAFDDGPGVPLIKKLTHLQVHLIALAGADARTYARHGYFGAMKTQIDHGIFDYCGAPVVTSELLLESETHDVAAHLDAARAVGGRVIAGARRHAAQPG